MAIDVAQRNRVTEEPDAGNPHVRFCGGTRVGVAHPGLSRFGWVGRRRVPRARLLDRHLDRPDL